MLNRKLRCVIICRIRKLYGEGIRILIRGQIFANA